ncbi:DNA-processing protein DprA [Larkinella soli]|uniref:DNA-processing protein DprA n=1 Tax=Larkinella soli TaxID=1770527 RepID=UPI001E37E34F|nr:DNA-processing protein DprA [Larkinella soli]
MDHPEPFYQLALTTVTGVGDVLIRQLISYCGSASEVFRSPRHRLLKIPGVGEVIGKAVLNPGVLSETDRIYQKCEKLGVRLLFYTEPGYPERLRGLYDAPALLFSTGAADLNPTRTIGIVGTRQATDYGRKMTEDLIHAVLPYRPLVISGLAYGIDIAAHRACLSAGLPTIGVLASGVDIIYPHVHRKTAQEMLPTGGLLTESRPGVKPDARLFPARNRIIAGMSDAVVVVEAAAKGGALITAEYANNYHREVLAVPGFLTHPFSQGCHKLIREKRADIYTRPEDLIESLRWDQPEKPVHLLEKPALTHEFTEEESQILALLRKQPHWHIDELSWRSGMPVSRLASLLLNLEFQGVVRSLPGKKFQLS